MQQEKGVFVLSLDTELAWGSFDLELYEKLKNDFENTRYCIARLIELLCKYKIKATFALVGHLMLDRCSEKNGIRHKEIIRPKFSWYNKDWFSEDPSSSIQEAPHWYGTDILMQIREAQPKHEIACHSFCHIIYGDPGCSEECAESDIAAAVETAKIHGINLTTFIFPRNSEGHKALLKKYGFIAYRGNGNEWYSTFKNNKLKKICHFVDEMLSISPKTSKLQADEYGLYNTTGNMLYLSRQGIRKIIPISSRIRKAKKGIRRAIERGEVFHMWFHPFNLASDPEGLLKGLEKIFAYVRMKIDSGQLINYTINELCEKQSGAVAVNVGILNENRGVTSQA
ncbi:MAG TPA: polysaccharide deacetylase family protein [Clostridiales bacterium]|nr:polysaccharide deacetylase family protein [Clostridiales bacterium]